MNDNKSMQYSLGYQDGFLDAKKQFERPQGRWITEDVLHCLYYCSECRTNGNKYQPFCGWCGAKMKGVSDNG